MSSEVKIAALILVSVGFGLLTWRSLWSLRSHGPYRLLAWVSVWALVLLNLDYWFSQPFVFRQMISWLLMAASIATVVYGAISLRRGRPDSRRHDATLTSFEKTTVLITSGAYRYIRHPMYSSLLFGAAGVFLKHITWQSALIAGISIFFTVLTARTEEAENIQYFGDAYCNYMKRTKMFIPYLV